MDDDSVSIEIFIIFFKWYILKKKMKVSTHIIKLAPSEICNIINIGKPR